MKKIISLLLAFTLALCCLPAFAAEAPSLTVAVASDLHYNLPEETLTRFTDDPLYGHANRRAAMENESGFIIDAFLADCAKKNVDFVLISGDLADNGRSIPEEHYAVRDKLLAFEKATGIEVFVIDGNHDLGSGAKTDIADFKEIYKDLGYDHARSARAEDCSYTADLGDRYLLIALDSCDPTVSTEDGMSLAKTRWVLEEANAAYKDGRFPLLMMHHNLLDHMPLQRLFSHNFIVRNHFATAALFADAGIKVVFTGHEHCSDAAVYTSPAGNVIRDFATTSLTMYPLAYRLMRFSDEEIRYGEEFITSIDTAALAEAVDGYTPAILAAMEADLTAFSKQYLKKGVAYRLSLSLTMEKSGIEPGSPFYPLVDAAFSSLRSLLEMPLYGEGSAAALAASYNIEIPATPFATGWDLATELVSAHYAGSEHYDITGPEVTALLRLASLILKYVPDGVSDDLFTGAAGKIVNALTLREAKALCRSVFGGVTPGEVFAAALVSGLVYGFANDADGLDDNNGAFEGYGKTDRVSALSQKLTAFFNKILLLVKNVFAVIGN